MHANTLYMWTFTHIVFAFVFVFVLWRGDDLSGVIVVTGQLVSVASKARTSLLLLHSSNLHSSSAPHKCLIH